MAAVRSALFIAALTFVLGRIAAAADTPEEVFAKFHAAALAGDLEAMKRYGTSDKGAQLDTMPAAMTQTLLGFMRAITPKAYAIESKSLAADGNRATLELSAMQQAAAEQPPQKVSGRATLVKENGEWKVDLEEWGGGPQAGAAPRKPKPQLQASLGPLPSTPAQGEVNGARFVAERAFVEQHDILHLRQGGDFFADHEVVIFLFLNSGQKLDGLKLNVTPDTGGDPHIHLRYKVPGKNLPETTIFMKDYVLRLELDKQDGKSIPGKIQLQLPTQPPTRISGAFVAEIK